jgi:hypothetical protein
LTYCYLQSDTAVRPCNTFKTSAVSQDNILPQAPSNHVHIGIHAAYNADVIDWAEIAAAMAKPALIASRFVHYGSGSSWTWNACQPDQIPDRARKSTFLAAAKML